MLFRSCRLDFISSKSKSEADRETEDGRCLESRRVVCPDIGDGRVIVSVLVWACISLSCWVRDQSISCRYIHAYMCAYMYGKREDITRGSHFTLISHFAPFHPTESLEEHIHT